MSGVVHRLRVETADGEKSLVVKHESVELVERALAFRDVNESLLAGSIPTLYGWALDGPDGTGILVLEDVSPAIQGDELRGCSPNQARSLIGVIARLHASTWDANGVSDGWGRRRWEPGRWNDRLARAATRYPAHFMAGTLSRLHHFDLEADAAASELASGASAWIHGDPHLDNVLWRPSGEAVVLDWATAGIGPPAFDVAVLLMSLAMGPAPALAPQATIESYQAEITRHGTDAESRHVTTETVRLALRQLIQGMIGFVGLPTEPPEPRTRLLRDHAATSTVRALAWIDE